MMLVLRAKKIVSGLMAICLLFVSMNITVFAEDEKNNREEIVVGESAENSLVETYTGDTTEINDITLAWGEDHVLTQSSYKNIRCINENTLTIDSSIEEVNIENINVEGNVTLDATGKEININKITWIGGTLTIYGNVNIEQKIEMAVERSASLVIKQYAEVNINNTLDISLTRAKLGNGTSLEVEPYGQLNVAGDVLGYKNGNALQGYFYPKVTVNGMMQVDGNFIVNGEYVYMTEDTAHLIVEGDYKQEIGQLMGYWGKDSHFTAGVLEVKGDYLYDSIGSNQLTGRHNVFFTGDSKQSVYGIFRNVWIGNTSPEGVVFTTLGSGNNVSHTKIWGTLWVAEGSVISGSSTETILRNPVSSFEISSYPDTMKYLPNTEFDPTGMGLSVTYENGETEETWGGWTLSYDFGMPYGEKSVIVEFGGKTQELKVEVAESVDIDSQENMVQWGDHYYQFFEEQLTWKEAKQKCEELGGHLLTITSKEEQDFILSSSKHNANIKYWLGATDEKTEGDWKWITGESFDYVNWNDNQPDNKDGVEDYLVLNEELWNFGWNDAPNENDGLTGYICEYEAPISIRTPNPDSVALLEDDNSLDITMFYKADEDWPLQIYIADIVLLQEGKIYLKDYESDEVYFELDLSNPKGLVSIENGSCIIHATNLPVDTKMYVYIPQAFLETTNGLYQFGEYKDKEWYFTTKKYDFDFSPEKDGWKFGNNNGTSGFNYGKKYQISEDKYKYVYGDTEKEKTIYESATTNKDGTPRYWKGNCFGMSVAVLLIKNGFPSIDSYSKEYIVDLDLQDRSSKLNIQVETVKDMIETLQISQYLAQISNEKWANTNRFYELIESVKKHPTHIDIRNKKNEGHVLIGYRTEDKKDSTRVYVYDPNRPKDTKCYITFVKENGIYVDWKYKFQLLDWWAGSDGGEISFLNSTADFEEILKPTSNQDDDMELLSIGAENFVLQNEKGEIANINNGEISSESGLEGIIPVWNTGVALDGNGNIIQQIDANHLYYFPHGEYSLVAQDNPFSITISGQNTSVLADIEPFTTFNFTTSNANTYREASIEPSSSEESFSVAYRYSSGADRLYDIMTLQGKTSEKVQVNETEQGISFSGVDDITISASSGGKEVKQNISDLNLYATISADVVEIKNNLFLSLNGDKDGDGISETEIVPPIPFDNVPVADIQLDQHEIKLDVGERIGLSARIVPTNASNQNVTWTSSNSKIVNVDQFGNVKAINTGVAYVTVTTTDGSKTDTCKVIVKDSSDTNSGNDSDFNQNTTQQDHSSNKIPNYSSSDPKGQDVEMAVEDNFWDNLVLKIESASGKQNIVVDASGRTLMPKAVLKALNANENVTLTIKWGGGEPIIISAGQVQTDPLKYAWRLEELANLCNNINSEKNVDKEVKNEISQGQPDINFNRNSKSTSSTKISPETGEIWIYQFVKFTATISLIGLFILKKK